mmetsp:Transcript_4954/g.12071  ORF Transcript_4954/g.12071 Transcript_4954/m.12071 type:complete len:205 (-) Transcript_4954:364-978(-)
MAPATLSLSRITLWRLRRGTMSFPTTTEVHHGSICWACCGLTVDPGGEKHQARILGKLCCSLRATRAATPAPRLCPVTTSRQLPWLTADSMSSAGGLEALGGAPLMRSSCSFPWLARSAMTSSAPCRSRALQYPEKAPGAVAILSAASWSAPQDRRPTSANGVIKYSASGTGLHEIVSAARSETLPELQMASTTVRVCWLAAMK